VSLFDPTFLLFVPGDRPDRFEKAAASAAGGVILDLEDAVAVENKAGARESIATYLDGNADSSHIAVRINAPNTPWFDEDVAMLRTRRTAALVLPKTPNPAALDAVEAALKHVDVIALLESAQGILHAADIAAHPRCIALAFGPFDLAADLGCSDEWEVLLPYRMQVLLAARAYGKRALDGPTLSISDPSHTEKEARAALRLGYDGKFLIHPAQIAPARKAFAPSREQIDRASRIVEAGKHAALVVVDGMMIDQPLVAAARRVLERAGVHAP
jgi:citrate lyase subunit beta/citryl-CoA lyase